jgi:hypothetical protein
MGRIWVIGEHRIGTDEYVVSDIGAGRYIYQALDVDPVPDGGLPFNDCASSDGYLIPNGGLLPDQHIMACLEKIPDGHIAVDHRSGPDKSVFSDDGSGKTRRSHTCPGRKSEHDSITYDGPLSDSVDSVFYHYLFRTNITHFIKSVLCLHGWCWSRYETLKIPLFISKKENYWVY